MRAWSLVLPTLASFAIGLNAALLPIQPSRTIAARDSSCTNGPDSRQCWSDGFDINTDFDLDWPNTGVTVTYNLEITNTTCNPDGHGARICLLVNGQYPGPVIRANWGDMVVVNVKNSMQDNGTSIHWHGVRQLNTNGQDGVNGVTQCPIAPGSTMTYQFQATQYGTTWYHSHYSTQYGDGVLGTMVFEGPASANYDIDLGTYTVSDWYYMTAFQVQDNFAAALQQTPHAAGPNADNTLINGTNKNSINGGGSYSQVTIEQGKSYRLRLICTSVDNYFYVSLDNHTFEVITSDFVPIIPITATQILMGPGQRYDVIINATQPIDSYYFRVVTATVCASGNNGDGGLAIFNYEGATGTPTGTAYPSPTVCQEPTPLVPYWSQSVPEGNFTSTVQELTIDFTQAQIVPGEGAIFVWALNYSSIDISWEMPTLSYVMNGNTSYPSELNILPTVNEGSWNYWLIQEYGTPPIPHPIHLHGHDFFVLGQGHSGNFSSESSLNFQTPTRRDTASIYGGGWLAIAFESDNPGAWLTHCHIAWHISGGLGWQFLESPSKIVEPDKTQYDAVCQAWDDYIATAYYQKNDSGL